MPLLKLPIVGMAVIEGSGVAVDSEFWQVWTIRSGKVVWWRAYATEAEALQATGRRLRE